MSYAQQPDDSLMLDYPRVSIEPMLGISFIDGGYMKEVIDFYYQSGFIIDEIDIFRPLLGGIRTGLTILRQKKMAISARADAYFMYASGGSNGDVVLESSVLEPGISVIMPFEDASKVYYNYISFGPSVCHTSISVPSGGVYKGGRDIPYKIISRGKSYEGYILETGGDDTGIGWYIEIGVKIPLWKLIPGVSLRYRKIDLNLVKQKDFSMSGLTFVATLGF
jgi:hypothetical protein